MQIIAEIKPIVYMMVGLPGSGKSYYADFHLLDLVDGRVISNDDMVEQIAYMLDMTYDQVWKDVINLVTKYNNNLIRQSAELGVSFVIDMTNLSVNSRKSKLQIIKEASPVDYHRVAIVVPTPEEKIWKERLNRPGKMIPDDVLQNMAKYYVEPSKEEGFDEIIKL